MRGIPEFCGLLFPRHVFRDLSRLLSLVCLFLAGLQCIRTGLTAQARLDLF